MTIISPSHWLKQLAEKSMLAQHFSIEFIPHGIDLDIFSQKDPDEARRALGLPLGMPVIFFSTHQTSNIRKGFSYLLEALALLELDQKVCLLTIGEPDTTQQYDARYEVHELGFVSSEEQIAQCYNAADIFVFPTLADNQPLVILEALACGTPVVSFDVGGVGEMVRHMETGYLAEYKNVEELAQGMHLLLTDEDLLKKQSHRSREIAEEEYDIVTQVQRYLQLYQQLMMS